MQRLFDIRKDNITPERRQATIDLCASAYPDIPPWQVDTVCSGNNGTEGETLSEQLKEDLTELYYTYLSLLMHPIDGHHAARHDPALVKVCKFFLPNTIELFFHSFHTQCY